MGKDKTLSVKIVLFVLMMFVCVLGIGIVIGMKYFSNNNSSNTAKDNKEEKTIIKNIVKDLLDGKYEDKNINAEVSNSDDFKMIEKISINGKVVAINDPFNEIAGVYKVEDNYLITTSYGNYCLYDKNGTLLQTINELDENYMKFGISDRLNDIKIYDNVIEVYGDRTDGLSPLLEVKDVNNEKRDIYMCNEEELSKANITDDYIVIAKYQLIYNSNKFEIKKIPGSEITLGTEKKRYCNS